MSRRTGLWHRLLAWLRPRRVHTQEHTQEHTREHTREHQRALDLLAAVDAGGLPLNPARVNHIARQLGLEVSVHAPVEQTIARIRAAMSRQR